MKPEYMNKPWHISCFNNGYEICYVGEDLMSRPMPLASGNDGISEHLELVQHIVELHNKSLRENS